MQWAGQEKISHLSNRNSTKWSKTNLFAYLCSYKSSIRVTITGSNNVFETIWKNGNKEYNEKYIYCFFRTWNRKRVISCKCWRVTLSRTTIWNLKSAVTYNCGTAVLSRTSVYSAISKLVFMFFSCTMHYTVQLLFLHCTFHVSVSFQSITIESKCC